MEMHRAASAIKALTLIEPANAHVLAPQGRVHRRIGRGGEGLRGRQ